ncbi:MAG: OmpA family protein [Novosphingobium sp.]
MASYPIVRTCLGLVMSLVTLWPTPAAPSSCNTGPWFIFFDTGQSAIDDVSSMMLDHVLAASGSCNVRMLRVDAYADTEGSFASNRALSERRAQSVVRYLVERGKPRAEIVTFAFGETQLRVPTPDGVSERQNRRIEMRYDLSLQESDGDITQNTGS